MAETETLQRPVPVGRGNSYPDEAKAAALAALDANHGNVKRTARQLGIPESSLRYLIDTADDTGDHAARVRALRAAKRDDLAVAMSDIAWIAARQVQDRLPEASARDAAVVMGIAVDKAQLLRGLPTQVHGQAAHPVLGKLSAEQLRAVRAALATVVVDAADSAAVDAADTTVSPADTPLSPRDTSLSPAPLSLPETPQ